jgi:hypothetical protein
VEFNSEARIVVTKRAIPHIVMADKTRQMMSILNGLQMRSLAVGCVGESKAILDWTVSNKHQMGEGEVYLTTGNFPDSKDPDGFAYTYAHLLTFAGLPAKAVLQERNEIAIRIMQSTIPDKDAPGRNLFHPTFQNQLVAAILKDWQGIMSKRPDVVVALTILNNALPHHLPSAKARDMKWAYHKGSPAGENTGLCLTGFNDNTEMGQLMDALAKARVRSTNMLISGNQIPAVIIPHINSVRQSDITAQISAAIGAETAADAEPGGRGLLGRLWHTGSPKSAAKKAL